MPPCWGHVWGMGTAEITRSNFEYDFFSADVSLARPILTLAAPRRPGWCTPIRNSSPAQSARPARPQTGLVWPAARRLSRAAAIFGRSGSATRRLGRASFTNAAMVGMRGLRIESWCELHALGGCGHSMPTRRTSELAVGVLSWRSSRELGRSRVQWRARGYLGHQVVVLAHSEEGCALGLCLSTFTSRQWHISPPPPVLSPGQQPLEATQLE